MTMKKNISDAPILDLSLNSMEIILHISGFFQGIYLKIFKINQDHESFCPDFMGVCNILMRGEGEL